jgi:1-acyl-sn-glycerol-3-phosphate acyltransferase
MTPVVGVPAPGLSADLAAPVDPATPGHPAPRRSGHPWAPVSACGPPCLPAPGTLPRVGHLRVAARLTGLVSLLLATALAAGVLPLLAARWRAGLLRRLFRAVLRVVGVRLVHRGADRFDLAGEADGGVTSGVLVVANHLSWLDILVLGAVQPLRMVAKREIRAWPVIGALAARVGTLFVDRAGLRELPTVVAQAADALRAGAVVGLFPEGTTWCGAARGPFRRAGFQAALDAGVPVRPVAQRMRLPDGTPTSAGAFLGEDTLLDSLLRVVRLPELVLEVDVLPALPPEPGLDRRELARRAELAIASATGAPAPAVVTDVPSATRPAPRRPADVSAAA